MWLLVVVVEEGSICALCGRGVYLFGGALSRLTVWCIGVFSGLRMYTFVRVFWEHADGGAGDVAAAQRVAC